MELTWKIRVPWLWAKLFCKQLFNCLIGKKVTQKGHAAYDYYCKVAFTECGPESYADHMFEDDLKRFMEHTQLNRKEAAIVRAGMMAQWMAPWDFLKKEYKIVG